MKKMGFLSADTFMCSEAMSWACRPRRILRRSGIVKFRWRPYFPTNTQSSPPLYRYEKASSKYVLGSAKMQAAKAPLPVFPTQGGTTNMCASTVGERHAATPSGLSSTRVSR